MDVTIYKIYSLNEKTDREMKAQFKENHINLGNIYLLSNKLPLFSGILILA